MRMTTPAAMQGELHQDRPPVLGVDLPAQQPLGLESGQRPRHRRGVQLQGVQQPADLGHRQREKAELAGQAAASPFAASPVALCG
jgi:hypothetical protein